MAKTALITGGTGFVGGRVAHFLAAAGWRVTAVHRHSTSGSGLEKLKATGIAIAEFREYAELQEIARELSPDALFHLAAHQTKDPPDDADAFLDANVKVGMHVLEGLSGSGCIVVNAMSYLQFRGGQPLPTSLYSATKEAFLVISQYYSEHRGLDVRNVVLYDNYGPHDPRTKLVPQLVVAARDHSAVHMGSGDQQINILYVDDVALGLIAAGRPGNPSMMTVRAPASITVRALAGEVERQSGRVLQATYDSTSPASDQPQVAGEWPLPKNWQPAWSLECGIQATMQGS